ncbi:MAG TPA: NAD(+) synthase [Candidatus Saccharimonadales bacterium]
MERELSFKPEESYIRVATACPEVALADVPTNVERIEELFGEAADQNVALISFPEMSITGYTLGDLVNQNSLLNQAKNGLIELALSTEDRNCAMVVGLPMNIGNRLYNCAAVLADGKIKGIVTKTNLPTYGEFYEDRWFDTWDQDNGLVNIDGQDVPFGTKLLFEIGGTKVGVEICEDLWVAEQPSTWLALNGALVVANPSASPEQIGKPSNRRKLVEVQSGRLICGYLYAGADVSESTAEVVMSGHQLIGSNGKLAAESKPFAGNRLLIAEIDTEHLEHDRRRLHMANYIGATVIKTCVERSQTDLFSKVNRNPFLPEESEAKRRERLGQVVAIQAHGLAMRLKKTKTEKVVLGLSGGLDSTLALLVACETAKILGVKPKDLIQTITMPGLASSEDTQSNATALAILLDIPNKVIPISQLANMDMFAIDHDAMTQDITFENAQARARTTLLFNFANKNGGIVLGTSDLSEIALGWCTYNGDQQSHYNVNGGIPKTVVKEEVKYLSTLDEYKAGKELLDRILGTLYSPELVGNNRDISQNTEDIIGPYELHDFFLNRVIRWGDSASKIAYLACSTFEDTYSSDEVKKWLGLFVRRFASNQFKRENMPNGPKIASVSLSPRGDWRMPADLYNAAIWEI